MDKKYRKRLLIKIAIIPSSFLFILLGVLLLAHFIPSFINIPIPPPNIPGNTSSSVKDWKSITYSAYEDQWSKSRYYLLRKEIVLSINNESSNNFRTKLFESFDKNLGSKGWTRKNKVAPCFLFFSDLDNILDSPDNDYEVYLKENSIDYSTSDFICVLTWRDKSNEKTDGYHLIMLTVRPSFLNKIISLIFPD